MPACLDKTCRLEKLDVCELAGRKKRRKRKRCRHCGVSMPMENSRQKLTLYSNSDWKSELTSFAFWKAVRCEFLATLFYVLIGCGASLIWSRETQTSQLQMSVAFGLSATGMLQCVGHVSGAHMNPAITVSMLVTRNITILRSFVYSLSQCIGAIAGAGILYGITPSRVRSIQPIGVTRVREEVSLGQAFGVEFLATFLLVLTVFARTQKPISIGLGVSLSHLFAYNYTGAGMNPARSLGPALINNTWTDHWVYWIGPLLGGIIGAFTYEYTHDSADNSIKRTLKKKRTTDDVERTANIQSCTSASTEIAFTPTPTSEDLKL